MYQWHLPHQPWVSFFSPFWEYSRQFNLHHYLPHNLPRRILWEIHIYLCTCECQSKLNWVEQASGSILELWWNSTISLTTLCINQLVHDSQCFMNDFLQKLHSGTYQIPKYKTALGKNSFLIIWHNNTECGSWILVRMLSSTYVQTNPLRFSNHLPIKR